MRLTPFYQENPKRDSMGLITALDSPPMSIAWGSVIMGDRLQHLREYHPSKTYNGATYTNPKIGDGAGRFGYDFSNAAIAPKVNAHEDPRSPALTG
jgi:hypothetical protein